MDRSFVGLKARLALAALLLAGAGSLLQACGGDEDEFEDIKATATAAAQKTPSPTVDPVDEYIRRASTLSAELGDLVNTLDADLIAAQQTQADPKWPQVLTGDIDLMNAKAQEILALTPPAGVDQTLTDALRGACHSLVAGGDLLKQAIPAADPTLAAKAVADIDAAENNLDAVRARLAAYDG